MGNRRIEYLQTAIETLGQTRKAKVGHGCFQISMMALGATSNLHFHDILYRPEDESLQMNIASAVQRHGFEVQGVFTSDGQASTEDDIEGILNYKVGDAYNLAGHLFMLWAKPESQRQNHSFVVLPREGLPTNISGRLKNYGEYVVVNTELPEGCIQMRAADIARLINSFPVLVCEVAVLGRRNRSY